MEGGIQADRLRLGHIVYSNCFPVHARLLDVGAPGWIDIVQGVPSHLNTLLERGEIDVAPCSSIEFARNADRYRVLPDLVIGARGPVRSIVFAATRPPEELDGALVAMPTASATSVVLLKVLLRLRWGVQPRFRWFGRFTSPHMKKKVRGFLDRVQCDQPGAVPMMTVMRHQGRDCDGSYLAGGPAEDRRTMKWYDDFAAAVGDSRVVIAARSTARRACGGGSTSGAIPGCAASARRPPRPHLTRSWTPTCTSIAPAIRRGGATAGRCRLAPGGRSGG